MASLRCTIGTLFDNTASLFAVLDIKSFKDFEDNGVNNLAEKADPRKPAALKTLLELTGKFADAYLNISRPDSEKHFQGNSKPIEVLGKITKSIMTPMKEYLKSATDSVGRASVRASDVFGRAFPDGDAKAKFLIEPRTAEQAKALKEIGAFAGGAEADQFLAHVARMVGEEAMNTVVNFRMGLSELTVQCARTVAIMADLPTGADEKKIAGSACPHLWSLRTPCS